MTAIEAKARALQKQEPEIWSNLPQDISRAIEEAVNQGANDLLCYKFTHIR